MANNSSLGFYALKQIEKKAAFDARMLETMTEADTETLEIIQGILNQVQQETTKAMKLQQEHEKCVALLVKKAEGILGRDMNDLVSKVLANSLDENRHNELLESRKKFIETIRAQADSDENEYFAEQERIMDLKNKVAARQEELEAVQEQIEAKRKKAEEEERKRLLAEEEEERRRKQAEEEAERKRKAEEEERAKKEEAERLRKEEEEQAARRRKAAEEKARQQEKERLDKEAEQQRKAKSAAGQKRKRQQSATPAEQHTPVKTRATGNRLVATERAQSPIWRQQQPTQVAVAKTPMKAASDIHRTSTTLRTPTPPGKPLPPKTPSTPAPMGKANPPVVPETPRPGSKNAKQPAWMTEQLAQLEAKESADNKKKGTPAPVQPPYQRTGTANAKLDKTMDTDYDDDSFWDDD